MKGGVAFCSCARHLYRSDDNFITRRLQQKGRIGWRSAVLQRAAPNKASDRVIAKRICASKHFDYSKQISCVGLFANPLYQECALIVRDLLLGPLQLRRMGLRWIRLRYVWLRCVW